MPNDSIKAGIQLVSYKVEKIDFSTNPSLSVLSKIDFSDCEATFKLGFRDALRLSKDGDTFYITGLQIVLSIYDSNKELIGHGEFIITGLFLSLGILDEETLNSLIKYQAPAILLPYLRSTITMTLVSAGYSSVILPLINIKSAAHDFDIQIKDLKEN